MPNICFGYITAIGRKDCLEEFANILCADYNYNNMTFSHKPHMFRIFDVYPGDEYDQIEGLRYQADFMIECAWSLSSCMFNDYSLSYYQTLKDKYKENFFGTTITEVAKKLNLQIEMSSEEVGMEFQEHYIIDNYGNVLEDECYHYFEEYIGDYDSFDDYVRDYDNEPRITEEEFNETKNNGGSYVIKRECEDIDDIHIPRTNMCNTIMCKRID